MKLDADEKEISTRWSAASGESYARRSEPKADNTRFSKATLKKDRRLNIRISTKDLEAIQKRALEEGLPYQTLIASLLHKYAAGRLREA